MDPDDCEDEDEEDEDEDDEGCGNGVADWLPPPPICCMAQPLTINRNKQIKHNLFADILLTSKFTTSRRIFIIITTNNEEIMCSKLNICSSYAFII